jgi:hypothetical protein
VLEIISSNEECLLKKANKGSDVSTLFTFENYNKRIVKAIIPKTQI